MTRREWYFWGYVLWFTFGLIGIAVAFAPYRMGIADPPSMLGVTVGFVGGLIAFVALEVWHQR